MSEDQLTDLYRKSSLHREEILASSRCGCFYCFETFTPDKVVEWVDEGQTAICPFCQVDSILSNTSCNISLHLLRSLHSLFFKIV